MNTIPDASSPLLSRPLRRRDRVDGFRRRFARSAKSAGRFGVSNYFLFLYNNVTGTSLFQIGFRIWSWMRRLNFVWTLGAIVVLLVTALAVSAIYMTILPGLLVLLALAVLFAVIRSGRMNRLLRRRLTGRHVVVIIPPDELSLKEDSFYKRNAKSMAASGAVVLFVSPHALRSHGLGGRGWYLTARKEDTDLFLVRRYYYFLLRRRVLELIDPELTVIY